MDSFGLWFLSGFGSQVPGGWALLGSSPQQPLGAQGVDGLAAPALAGKGGPHAPTAPRHPFPKWASWLGRLPPQPGQEDSPPPPGGRPAGLGRNSGTWPSLCCWACQPHRGQSGLPGRSPVPREASATQGGGQAVGPLPLAWCAGGGLSGREGHRLGARQIGDTVTLEGHPPGFL